MIELILPIIIENLGEEKAKELLGGLRELTSKLGEESIIVITRVEGKPCILNQNKTNADLVIEEGEASITNLEEVYDQIEEGLNNG